MNTTTEPHGLVTLQQHILEAQRAHPTASGEFSWLLSGITLATKIIASQVRRAGLLDVTGATDEQNVQGEVVQKLDYIANETLMNCLGYRGNISLAVSEEDDEPRVMKQADANAKYIVLFDPLDGSSNIDVNISVGTIFGVLQRREEVDGGERHSHFLQPGHKLVAAGYVVYGSSTIMAYSTGRGVHLFTLDPMIGAYILADEHVTMPATGNIYSVNEGYYHDFPEAIRRYLDWAKGPDAHYVSRYTGSLVADFHRTLLRGGIFLYPGTSKSPEGKLRLLYEANPLAFLAEQAGGAATDGVNRILDIEPTSLHQRVPLVIGSRDEVAKVAEFCR